MTLDERVLRAIQAGRCEECAAICWDGITPQDCQKGRCSYRRPSELEQCLAVMQVLNEDDHR